MSKLLLTEDDCAPDAWSTFNSEFKKITGMSKHDFLTKAGRRTTPDEGYTNYITHGGYKLEFSADDPYWKLYKID